jgi:outer membrane lipoprotein-sorting protein
MWLAFVVLFAVPADAPKDADQPLRRLEEKLSKAKSLHMDFEAAMEGGEGNGGKFKGTLDFQEGGKARLELKGDVAGKKSTMLMVSDGKRMSSTGVGPAKEPQDTPKKFDEILRGTVARSGVLLPLFTVANVQDGEKPKETDVNEMFKVSDVTIGKKEKLDDKEAQVVEYKLTIKSSKDSLSVTVWLDPKTALPMRRVLKSKQERQAMTITETYTDVMLDKQIAAKTFELPK